MAHGYAKLRRSASREHCSGDADVARVFSNDWSEVTMHMHTRQVFNLLCLIGLASVGADRSAAAPSNAIHAHTAGVPVHAAETGMTHLAADDTNSAAAATSLEVPDDTPLYAGVQIQQVSNNEGVYYVSGGSSETIEQVSGGLDRDATRLGWTQTESTKAEAIGGEGRVLKYKKGERTMEIYLAPGLDAPGTSVSINLEGEATRI